MLKHVKIQISTNSSLKLTAI